MVSSIWLCSFLFAYIIMFTKRATNLQFFPQYWEKAEFPFQIVPKLGALHVSGGTIKVIPMQVLVFSLFVP